MDRNFQEFGAMHIARYYIAMHPKWARAHAVVQGGRAGMPLLSNGPRLPKSLVMLRGLPLGDRETSFDARGSIPTDY